MTFLITKESGSSLALYRQQGILSLKDLSRPSLGGVSIDFLANLQKLSQQKKRQGPLEKAVGKIDRENPPLIFDATMGFARDSLHFLSLGAKVVGFECSPLVYALLNDAYERASKSYSKQLFLNHLKIVFGIFEKEIHQISVVPDIIFLDPMYPDKEKSKSLPQKGMQILRTSLKNPTCADTQILLENALSKAKKRVIVKRPMKSDYLTKKRPTVSFQGSTTRYDVYSLL